MKPNNYHKKHIVHSLTINQAQDKKYFQIKLPANACKVIGLGVMARISGIQTFITYSESNVPIFPSNFSWKAGNIALKTQSKPDVFFKEDVSLWELLPAYERLIGIPKLGFNENLYSNFGNVIQEKSIDLSASDTFLEGFYTDTIQQVEPPYLVNIYLTCQLIP